MLCDRGSNATLDFVAGTKGKMQTLKAGYPVPILKLLLASVVAHLGLQESI